MIRSAVSINNLPIAGKLAAIVAVPLIALLVISTIEVVHGWRVYKTLGDLQQLTGTNEGIGGLVHELQKERGRTSGFMAADRAADLAGALEQQRREADAALQVFRDATAVFSGDPGTADFAEFVELLEVAETRLEALQLVRREVDNGTIARADAIGAYSRAVGTLIEMVNAISRVAHDEYIERQLLAKLALMQLKESAGIERAMGAAAYGAGEAVQAVHTRMMQLIGRQDQAIVDVQELATPQQVEALDAALNPERLRDFLRLRQQVANAPFGGVLDVTEGKAWFAASTARIDDLRALERTMIADIALLTEETRQTAASVLLWWIVEEVAVLILCVGLAIFVLRATVKPLLHMTSAMQALSQGDLDVSVGDTLRRDEIGSMARALEHFRMEAVDAEAARVERRTERERAEQARHQALQTMAESIERETGVSVATASETSARMEASAKEMIQASEAVQSEAQTVSSAAELAQATAQAVASASEQLTASIGEIAQQVGQATTATATTVEIGGQARDRLEALSQAVNEIGAVAELIAGIAEQTNLLALNATIEAARAGEAGKGFAVVAGEVKALANQTASSTEQINLRISEVQSMTAQAVEAMGEVTGNIAQIDEVTTAIAGAVEQQRAATGEIARNVQETSAAAQNVSERISIVSAQATQSGEQAQGVGALAGELHDNVALMQRSLTEVVQSSLREAGSGGSAEQETAA
ncbi:MAG: methyl-accepting chemotaxis protein [Kiloniellales bacterium]